MIEPFWWIRSAGVAAVPVSNREPQVSRRDRPTRAAFFVLHFPGRLFERSGIFFDSAFFPGYPMNMTIPFRTHTKAYQFRLICKEKRLFQLGRGWQFKPN